MHQPWNQVSATRCSRAEAATKHTNMGTDIVIRISIFDGDQAACLEQLGKVYSQQCWLRGWWDHGRCPILKQLVSRTSPKWSYEATYGYIFYRVFERYLTYHIYQNIWVCIDHESKCYPDMYRHVRTSPGSMKRCIRLHLQPHQLHRLTSHRSLEEAGRLLWEWRYMTIKLLRSSVCLGICFSIFHNCSIPRSFAEAIAPVPFPAESFSSRGGFG